jgi:hypothetical protein
MKEPVQERRKTMRERAIVVMMLTLVLQALPARAQWADAKLVAGQVGLHVTASFFGKLVLGRQPVGDALREALREGAAAGLVAHAGYSLAGTDARLALPGKLLVQKAGLLTRRSIASQPVFDSGLYSDWVLTHSIFHLRFVDNKAAVELDVVNAAFAARYLLAEDLELNAKRTLLSGALVFDNHAPPLGINGYHVPGVIWIDAAQSDDESILRHELIHSLQSERGSALFDLHGHGLRLNALTFVSGVPAFLEGWPSHNRRLHEQEAHWYTERW